MNNAKGLEMSQPAKLLIVDDEELIRLNLRALLEDLGYRVTEAADGRGGLDAFDRERPDLVLADLRMPVMDGLSMVAALREKSPETPVIVISGAGTVREAVDSLRLGAWDYIMKPVPDSEGLDITIKRVLEKARLVRENRLYREHLEKTAEALRGSEERYALAVEGANDVIWDLNLSTGEAYHSKRFKSILGYEENEIPDNINAREWRERTHPDDYQRVTEARDSYLEGRVPVFEVEFRLRHKDGSYRWVLSRGACLRDPRGKPYRMAGSLTDITEHKKLEQQLLQSQKMESIGILAGGVAHEFNNLLTAISGYGQILQESIPADDEPSRESIGNVLKAAERAAALTRSLLAFSRKQTIKPEPVRIDTIIGYVGKLIQRVIGEDIEISVNLSGEDLPVKADVGQIEQVLMNLATNARDAMPRGGRLCITTGKVVVEEGSEARYDLSAPGEYALISFADTGTGIDKESLGKIFEPFYTTKEVGKGTGLGLSLAHGIIKQHNGSILVSSEIGKGTIFNIYLPLIEEHMPKGKSKMAAPRAGRMETLLVAEDEEIVRTFMKKILERAGYRVIDADNGENAVSLFREHDGISLVLSDVVMPGKNGKEMLDEIRKIKPGIKAVFISGYAAEVMHDKGILEEGIELIMKPFKKDDLLRKVRKILDGD
jgi:PAS domain S-box-containing protein